jgi:hypothetical protein
MTLGAAAVRAEAPLPPFEIQADLPIDGYQMLGPLVAPASEKPEETLARFFGDADPRKASQAGAIWVENLPYLWFIVRAEEAGRLAVCAFLGSEKLSIVEGKTPAEAAPRETRVYLRRELVAKRDERLVLAISSNNPVRVWLDEKRLGVDEDGRPECWTRPGTDRFLQVVDLSKGAHTLFIETTPPEYQATWLVAARFVNAASFTAGKVRYPAWNFESAPPWKRSDPPQWLRWGDPAIQEYLGLAKTPCLIGAQRADEDKPFFTKGIDMGDRLPFPEIIRGFPPRSLFETFDLHAEIVADKASAVASRLRIHPASPRDSVVLGDPTFAPIPVSGGAITLTPEGLAKQSPDFQQVHRDLERPALLMADAHGVRLDIVLRSLGFLADTSPNPRLSADEWRRLSAPLPRNNIERVSYNMIVPEIGAAAEPHPLVLYLPPSYEDAFYPALREEFLVRTALERGCAVVVFGLPLQAPCREAGPLPNATHHEAIDAILDDAAKRFPVDPARVRVVSSRGGAAFALSLRLSGRRVFEGIGCLDMPRTQPGVWRRFLDAEASGPAYFFESPRDNLLLAEIRAAKRPQPERRAFFESGKDGSREDAVRAMFDFFEAHPLDPRPSRVGFQAATPGQARHGWVHVPRAFSWIDPVVVEAAVEEGNRVRVQTKNVRRLELDLEWIPGLIAGKPIEIFINDSRLAILDRRPPSRVALQEIEDDNEDFWALEDISDRKDIVVPEIPLAQLRTERRPWSDRSQGGLRRIMAAAARETLDAEIGIAMTDMPMWSLPAGPLLLNDVCAWLVNTDLCSTTLPLDALVDVLENDFEGAGLFVIDGLDMLIENGVPGVDRPEDAPAGLTATAGRGAPRLIPISLPPNTGNVSVAGSREAIETLVGRLENRRRTDGDGVAAPYRVDSAGFSLFKAVVLFIQENPGLKVGPPNYQIMPHKKTENMRTQGQ